MNTLKLILKDIDKYSDKVAVINQSIVNGWQGLFELKVNKAVGTKQTEKPDRNVFGEMLEKELAKNEQS